MTCLIMAAIAWDSSYSQTQQGLVKTIGRPGKPGTPLSNVTIRTRGQANAVVSSSTGEFHIQLPEMNEGDPFILQEVRKNGYSLKDKEIVGRPLAFSSKVPIEITMVDNKQLEEDKRKIEENAYKTAENNYRKKVKELERKKRNKEITAEKYRRELQSLQDKYEKYLSLVGDMADRYARTDYDQLDSIDYVINTCIENGELDKADSLILTIFDPETVLERNRAAKEEIQQRMVFAQSIIDKAERDLEAIRRDLDYAKRVVTLSDNLTTAYLAQGNNEKAIECLEKSLSFKIILYGEHSEKVIQTIETINKLKK